MRDSLQYIKSDLIRYTGTVGVGDFLRAYVNNPAFRWQVAFRLTRAHGLERFFGHFLWMINRNRGNIVIPRKTQIGYGLYIGHNGPIVVNPTAVIGDNCNLSQFVTIGSNSNHAATIGNNVYIGPSVCIVEDVTIGDNVSIGAGSVVTKDIPANATAAGNYAKVLNYNNPGRFVHRRWPRE